MPSTSESTITPRLTGLLHALADEKRLAVVDALRDGEHCVCDLQEVVGASQSLLSHHLRVLREAGLVRDRKEGRWVYYTVVPESLAEVEGFLAGVREEVSSTAPRLACCE